MYLLDWLLIKIYKNKNYVSRKKIFRLSKKIFKN